MSIPATAVLVLVFDLGMSVAAWLAAYGLRFNFEIPEQNLGPMWNALPVMLAIHALWFVGLRTYRPLWRYTSLPDVKRLAVAACAAGLTTPVALLMLGRLHLVPRPVMILAPILLFLLLAGARFVSRAWFDGHFVMERTLGRPVVILGAGNTAARLIADLQGSSAWQVVALLDDNESLHGASLGGVSIYGGIDLLPEMVARFRPHSAVISMPSASSEQKARATQLASSLGLDVLSVDNRGDSGIQGGVRLERIDPVDLLTTPSGSVDDPVSPDLVLGKVVLISGVDSPLGQAFCRQILALGPKALLCLDRSAKVLGELQRQLESSSVQFILGDCRDELWLKTVFEKYRPDVVCHLNASRIPRAVALGNGWETLRGSVLPVLRSIRCAVTHESGLFILISAASDSAEPPLVDAGLKLAESVCLAVHTSTTRCVCIRLDPWVELAHGELISAMKREIDAGGPVSVSDPQSEVSFLHEADVARLAVHAVDLSMQASEHSEDSVVVVRGGAPVRVAEFARNLVKLSGFSEDQIPLVFAGAQRRVDPEMSGISPTSHPRLFLSPANNTRVSQDTLEKITSWLDVPTRDADQITGDLTAWGIAPR